MTASRFTVGRSPAVTAAIIAAALALTGCAGAGTDTPPDQSSDPSSGASPTSEASTSAASAQEFPDIVGAKATRDGDGTFSFDVTVSSPYDTPERYADRWRVSTTDGDLLGEHMLTHDHASEQPFTRSQSGVEIRQGITTVVVEGRDQQNGYGGMTTTVELPDR